MCFCLLTSPPLRNRVLAIKKKNTDDSFLLSSFLLPVLDQHDTSLECWITIELLHFISFGFVKLNFGWLVGTAVAVLYSIKSVQFN